ncbi:2-nitropropane dioxygenase [Desulfuribacillus stibiiarsenatis]|uniref:Probable nitronate monooxygenase n=1 Tax=Desulfuribacillus stibiiarsenatis TaxID=1390249 RepID=A0A1E5LAH1_9FIRM|nr:nitronate monooxygenase [Desulfuribacillus stibiiarsenatis]OEH87049.1 2-nitropropane dioxygenase [Desulfuribacillus stibiiarsenatis]
MSIPQLKVAHMMPKLPIIQGGMAVRVSTAKLAAAVANNGGIGIIAGTGFSIEQLRKEIRKARELTSGKGYIGVNILFAARQFAELVRTSMEEKIDFIISGAGFSRDIYAWSREFQVPIVSIVSSAKFAKLAERMGAAAIVVEGKEAGGHLGTDRSVKDILPEVVKEVSIPVIAAGGIIDGNDIAEMLKMGASGVQMGTRFVASEECEAADSFKDLFLKAVPEEETVLINSPVGLPGRALRNAFTDKIAGDVEVGIESCRACLKHCSQRFCIFDALERAVDGDAEGGLVFSGEYAHRIKEILPVKKIMEQLQAELEVALSKSVQV